MNDRINALMRFVENYVGTDGAKVFRALFESNKELSYNDIITKTGLDEQTVRRVLYELNELGLVIYRRVQSAEDGRFTYYWTVNSYGINQALLNRKRLVFEKLKIRLNHEERTTFFLCINDGIRLSFDEALELDFRCPKCSSILVQEDRNPYAEVLREVINKLAKEIEDERKLVSS